LEYFKALYTRMEDVSRILLLWRITPEWGAGGVSRMEAIKKSPTAGL
jgi:hypothetical protein